MRKYCSIFESILTFRVFTNCWRYWWSFLYYLLTNQIVTYRISNKNFKTIIFSYFRILIYYLIIAFNLENWSKTLGNNSILTSLFIRKAFTLATLAKLKYTSKFFFFFSNLFFPLLCQFQTFVWTSKKNELTRLLRVQNEPQKVLLLNPLI